MTGLHPASLLLHQLGHNLVQVACGHGENNVSRAGVIQCEDTGLVPVGLKIKRCPLGKLIENEGSGDSFDGILTGTEDIEKHRVVTTFCESASQFCGHVQRARKQMGLEHGDDSAFTHHRPRGLQSRPHLGGMVGVVIKKPHVTDGAVILKTPVCPLEP